MKWLESEGIPPTTAYRWIRFSKHCKESEIGTIGSVNQALPPARRKRKEQDKKMEPEVETQEEASSVQQEEATNGDGTSPLPDSNESEREIQDLQEKLRKANEKIAELSETNKEAEGLLQENDRLKRLLDGAQAPAEGTQDSLGINSCSWEADIPQQRYFREKRKSGIRRGKDDSSSRVRGKHRPISTPRPRPPSR